MVTVVLYLSGNMDRTTSKQN